MVLLPAFASRPWRALHRALGLCGLLLALGAADAAAAPALAAPVAAARTAPGKAGRAGKKAGKAGKAAKRSASRTAAKPARASKGAKRTKAIKVRTRAGSRTAGRARRAEREGRRTRVVRAERSAPRPAAPSADEVAVPSAVIPEFALASAAPGTAPGAGNPFTLITRSAGSLLDGLVARARGQLGTRYVYGATAPDAALDCSSFARYVMEALGVRLPRTANQQARIGTAVPRDLTALRPGDLLTFGSPRRTSHVGIYLGQGRFIHASVRSGQVIETTIERNRSLFRRWQGARRLLAGLGSSDSVPAAGAAADELGTGTSGG